MTLRIGTAGWTIPPGYADRFPDDGSHLARYARVANAVEINSSFKKTHRPSTYRRWGESVPADFRFSVKLPKEITHVRRLVDVEEPLGIFLEGVRELGNKLGPLLVQLPPSLLYGPGVAAAFLNLLRERFDGAVVLEPRHASWFEEGADGILERWKVSRAAADPANVEGAGEPGGRKELVYYRLHGSPVMYRSPYSRAFLERLAARLGEWGDEIERWVIFDNTAEAQAVPNALDLMDYTKGR
ncbi:MAG: DUF72 domain-containing protein [Gemmatimonadota bacterium]|nr:MAG: DUF72 domain-containing protein [Gemmatimonadota bacterium]